MSTGFNGEGGKRKRGGSENIAPDPFPKLAVLYGAQHACIVGGVGGWGGRKGISLLHV